MPNLKDPLVFVQTIKDYWLSGEDVFDVINLMGEALGVSGEILQRAIFIIYASMEANFMEEHGAYELPVRMWPDVRNPPEPA